MRSVRFPKAIGLLLLLAVIPGVGGCSKKIQVVQVPEFWTPELKTIAVVPFTNATRDRGAALVVADALAAALRTNGTYRVYNRNELEQLLNERDRQIAFGSDPAAAAKQISAIPNVQAILVGTVNTYAVDRQVDHRKQPQYAYDENGNPYVIGYVQYDFVRNTGSASVSASLIRVPSGSPIQSTPGAVHQEYFSEGSPPRLSEHSCRELAVRDVVGAMVEQFAVVRKVIEVKEKEALRLSTGLFEGKWEEADQFSIHDNQMFVVVSLPPAADRNRFRIGIVPKGGREVIASQDIVWSRNFPQRGQGFPFSPKDLLAKAGGAGEFTVKLYSGEEPVLTRDFKIETGERKKKR